MMSETVELIVGVSEIILVVVLIIIAFCRDEKGD